MYLILIGWLYVAVMMALAEAGNPSGSVLGAVITFVLYGLLPCGLLFYILGTPERKRRLHRQRQEELAAWQEAQANKAEAETEVATATPSITPDGHGHPPRAQASTSTSTIAAMREKA